MVKTVLVNPVPGVTLYPVGGRGPFEDGRPTPLPEDHARFYMDAGHATEHAPVAATPALASTASSSVAATLTAAEPATLAQLEAGIADLGKVAAELEQHPAP